MLYSTPRGERLEALYVVAVHCGLREGELLALRWEDVSLEAVKPAVSVRRTLTRGENGRGWVVDASTKSARVGACALPGKQPLP
jgi:integrase